MSESNTISNVRTAQKVKYNSNDDRFALVIWKDKESYNVVPMNDVELRETYELSSVLYPVRWGVPKTKYRALIILIDTEANCQIKFEQITKYLVDESLKQKIQKKPTAKQSELSAKTNREACQIEMLESQISNQAIKIKDLDETVSHQLRQIKNLESKNREITEREKIKEKDIDHCNRQALMSIATCIFNNYGTQSEVQNLLLMQPEEEKEKSTVSLSVNHPDFQVSLALKKALMKMFNAEKKTSHIFRAFLNANYEQSLLGNNNADTLLHSEKLALKSFRDFISNLRNDFQEDVERKILREICAESRQKIWLNSPNTVFKVSGKDLTYDETAKTRSKSLNNKRKVNKENESSISLNKKQHLQPQQSQLLLTSSYSGNQQNNIQVPFIPMQINHNHLQNQYLSNQQNLLQHQSQFGSNHQNHMQQQTQYHSNQQNVSQILDKLNPNSNYMTSFSSQANYNQSQQALQSNWTLSNQYSNFQGLSPISSLSIPQKAQPINSATLSSENTLTFLQPAGSSDKIVSTSTIVYNPIDLEDEETQDFTNVN